MAAPFPGLLKNGGFGGLSRVPGVCMASSKLVTSAELGLYLGKGHRVLSRKVRVMVRAGL